MTPPLRLEPKTQMLLQAPPQQAAPCPSTAADSSSEAEALHVKKAAPAISISATCCTPTAAEMQEESTSVDGDWEWTQWSISTACGILLLGTLVPIHYHDYGGNLQRL